MVLAEQQRMQRLVEDLLLLARADEHVPLAREAVDLDDLAFEEGHRLRSTTSKRVDTSGVSAARVQGDADALRRMFRNLGENAARHSSERVDITLVERGSEVVLTVDDDGPGIPESERARVLQRFVRLDEARSRDDGRQRPGALDRRRGGPRPRRLDVDRAVPAWRCPHPDHVTARSGCCQLDRGNLTGMNIKRIGIVTAVGAAAVAIGTGIATAQPDDGEGTPITGEALTKSQPGGAGVHRRRNRHRQRGR